MRLLWVSNGHGEDTIGALLVRTFQKRQPEIKHTVLPLVGLGEPYRRLADVEVLEPTQALPSGGFSGRSPGYLWQDIRAGLFSLLSRQKRALSQQAQDAMVVVGDLYALYLAVRAPVRPIVFLPTAKSDYISPHLKWEISYMKKYAACVLARDAKTAESLRRAKVPAQYVGNPMLDAILPSGVDFKLPPGPTVAILPGSRPEAIANGMLLLEAARRLAGALKPVNFLFSRSPSIALERFAAALPEPWQLAPGSGPAEAEFVCDGARVLASTYFSDLICQAQLVLGMAGTANEQAAGLGKPIVTCPGFGPQFTERFVRGQIRLLGGAVVAVKQDPTALALEAKAILLDEQRYKQMAAQGKARMGEPGAASRMVEIIARLARAGSGG